MRKALPPVDKPKLSTCVYLALTHPTNQYYGILWPTCMACPKNAPKSTSKVMLVIMRHIHITPHHSISPIQEQKTRQAYLTSFKSNSNQETRQAYLSIWRAADKDSPKTQKHERMETKPCWARVDLSRSWAGKYAGALFGYIRRRPHCQTTSHQEAAGIFSLPSTGHTIALLVTTIPGKASTIISIIIPSISHYRNPDHDHQRITSDKPHCFSKSSIFSPLLHI